MDIFSQKCNKFWVRISLYEEKQNYKQTHIPKDISMSQCKPLKLEL